MEDDTWSFGFSTSSRSYPSALKSQSDLCIDFEEIEGDDDLKMEYPCLFCAEEFDLVGLCCHIYEEHPTEAKSGVCPVCTSRVGMNMVGHITTHGNIFKSQHKLKFRKGESYSSPSSLRKELQDEHFQSLLSGSSSLFSSSKMAPDPLLSFIYNVPVANESESAVLGTSTKLSLVEKSSDENSLERDDHSSPLSDEDHTEKARRCEFVQGLLSSAFLDDGL